jgi:hypothetical protein
MRFKNSIAQTVWLWGSCGTVLLFVGCKGLNRAQYTVGTHSVTLKGCSSNSYIGGSSVSINVDGKQFSSSGSGPTIGCDSMQIVVAEDSLTVDGKSYGTLQPNDSILVHNGEIFVNDTGAVTGELARPVLLF